MVLSSISIYLLLFSRSSFFRNVFSSHEGWGGVTCVVRCALPLPLPLLLQVRVFDVCWDASMSCASMGPCVALVMEHCRTDLAQWLSGSWAHGMLPEGLVGSLMRQVRHRDTGTRRDQTRPDTETRALLLALALALPSSSPHWHPPLMRQVREITTKIRSDIGPPLLLLLAFPLPSPHPPLPPPPSCAG